MGLGKRHGESRAIPAIPCLSFARLLEAFPCGA